MPKSKNERLADYLEHTLDLLEFAATEETRERLHYILDELREVQMPEENVGEIEAEFRALSAELKEEHPDAKGFVKFVIKAVDKAAEYTAKKGY